MAEDPDAAPSSADATTADAANTRAAASVAHSAGDGRRRHLALVGGLTLVIGALALFTVGRVWGSGANGYVVARNLDAPLLWPTVAALGALVLWSVRKARRGRTALDVLGWVLVPIVILAALRFGLATSARDGAQRHPSPDGSRTLVIQPVSSILDPVWQLRIESGHGLTKRDRIIECVNGDWSNVERVQWISPTTAKVVHRTGRTATDEVSTTLTFSGADGEHVEMTGHGLDSCTPGADSSPH